MRDELGLHPNYRPGQMQKNLVETNYSIWARFEESMNIPEQAACRNNDPAIPYEGQCVSLQPPNLGITTS